MLKRAFELACVVNDAVNPLGALVIDAAPTDGLAELRDHGPWIAGHVTQVTQHL